MSQKLEKLAIKNLDTGGEFQVMYNPGSYSISLATNWKPQGRTWKKPALQFDTQALKTIAMELFLDTYESGSGGAPEDVRTYTDQVSGLLFATVEAADGRRPPILQLRWGTPNTVSGFPEKCVLTGCNESFVLFTPQGIPVRAKLSVSFQEFVNLDEAVKAPPALGKSPASSVTVMPGDTVAGLAESKLGDAGQWRSIAEANGLDDPLHLPQGLNLRLPSGEEAFPAEVFV